MTVVTEAKSVAAPDMTVLVIRDCTFFLRGFFIPPRPFASLDLLDLPNRLLEQFKDFNLTAGDVSLDRGDSLFGYSLKTQLFNRFVSFVIASGTLDATCTRLVR